MLTSELYLIWVLAVSPFLYVKQCLSSHVTVDCYFTSPCPTPLLESGFNLTIYLVLVVSKQHLTRTQLISPLSKEFHIVFQCYLIHNKVGTKWCLINIQVVFKQYFIGVFSMCSSNFLSKVPSLQSYLYVRGERRWEKLPLSMLSSVSFFVGPSSIRSRVGVK